MFIGNQSYKYLLYIALPKCFCKKRIVPVLAFLRRVYPKQIFYAASEQVTDAVSKEFTQKNRVYLYLKEFISSKSLSSIQR